MRAPQLGNARAAPHRTAQAASEGAWRARPSPRHYVVTSYSKAASCPPAGTACAPELLRSTHPTPPPPNIQRTPPDARARARTGRRGRGAVCFGACHSHGRPRAAAHGSGRRRRGATAARTGPYPPPLTTPVFALPGHPRPPRAMGRRASARVAPSLLQASSPTTTRQLPPQRGRVGLRRSEARGGDEAGRGGSTTILAPRRRRAALQQPRRGGSVCSAASTRHFRRLRQAAENAKSHGNRLRRGAALP